MAKAQFNEIKIIQAMVKGLPPRLVAAGIKIGVNMATKTRLCEN